MSNLNSQLTDKNGNNVYPITTTGNVSGLAGQLANLANKDLSNVNFPTFSLDGSAHTGAGDRVIEMKVSSDGSSWYRVWASGWQECGQTISTSNNTDVTVTYPKAFKSKVVTVNATYLTYTMRDKPMCIIISSASFGLTTFVIRNQAGTGFTGVSYYACGY